MEEYTLEMGLVIIFVGVIRILRDYLITLNSSVLLGTVSKVKSKSRKGYRYYYPKIIVHDEGYDVEKSYPSAKKRNRDYYSVGQELSLYKYTSFIFKETYKPLIGFWYGSFIIILSGTLIVLLSLGFHR